MAYRYAADHLRDAFSNLPGEASPQFNRLVRFYTDDIERMALNLARMTAGSRPLYQAIDASAMPVRDAKRRGHGWLAGQADIGSIGCEGGLAQLLYLAQRPTRSPPAGLRRLVGMVTS